MHYFRIKKRRFFAPRSGLLALLFLLSALLVACSSGPNTASTTSSAPTPTLSIQMGDIGDLSPTPTPLLSTCGAWTTQTSPPYGTDRIGVNAKFVKLVNGNPQGVDGANATATVLWGDGTVETLTVQTTFDGLAVFTVQTANHPGAVNKETLVTVHFDKPGFGTCDVDSSRAAFFTLVTAQAPPSATPGANRTPGINRTGGAGGNQPPGGN